MENIATTIDDIFETLGNQSGISDRQQERLNLAAFYIDDFLHGQMVRRSDSSIAIKLYKIRRSKRYNVFIYSALITFCVLVNYEISATLKNHGPQHLDPHHYIIHIVEAIIALVSVFDTLLEIYVFDKASLYKSGWFRVKVFVQVIVWAEIIIIPFYPGLYRASGILRPLLIIERDIYSRMLFTICLVTVPKLSGIFLLIFFEIVFFGFIAYVVFRNWNAYPWPSDPNIGPTCSTFLANCNDYFKHPWEGMFDLFILLTTVNFPDIMMP